MNQFTSNKSTVRRIMNQEKRRYDSDEEAVNQRGDSEGETKCSRGRELDDQYSEREINVRERREVLQSVIQDTRFAIVQTILSHPEQLPSRREIAFANPNKSESTIREHIQDLQDKDIITEVTLADDQRSRDLPRKFYGVTTYGYKFLEDHRLISSEETLREVYKRTKKPDVIERYEEAPRPRQERLVDVYQTEEAKEKAVLS